MWQSVHRRNRTVSLRDLKNTEHTAAEEILRSHLLSNTPTSRTTKSTGRQPNSSHLSTHGIADTSWRPSKFSSTTQFHKTSVSSSVTFCDPYYGPKDIYSKSTTQPRLRDLLHQSTTLPPLCFANNWFSSVSTHSLSKDPSQQYHQFPACTLQRTNHPASSFAWSSSRLKQQHFPESGILLRTIRAYWSKRLIGAVTSSSFQN